MPALELIDPHQSLSQQLGDALRYPLRPAALPGLVGFTLAHFLSWLPLIGWLVELIVWAATFLYALECLRHSADGFAQPPEFAEPGLGGWALVAILIWSSLLALAVQLNLGSGAWLVGLLMAVTLPAIAMSLAMDGSIAHALNPLTWLQIMSRFGAVYLLLIGVQWLVALVVSLAQSGVVQMLPSALALPLFYGASIYATLFNFRLMGLLIHQRHAQFGLQPKAHQLATQTGQDDDQRLLDDVQAIADEEPRAALDLLVPRLRDRAAPDALHRAYRQLLQQQGLHDALLVHGQIWSAALIAQGQARRALGIVQECVTQDTGFVPDDPRTCGELADLAFRLGMHRLALHLCRGYLTHWPRDPQTPHYGLLATRLLADQPEHLAEAGQLLDKLIVEWPDHPLRSQIVQQKRRLAGTA